MPTTLNPQLPRIANKALIVVPIVHVQAVTRRPTDRARPQNLAAITTPAKMIRPFLRSGIEQWDFGSTDWINADHEVVAPFIAAPTGQSEINQFIRTAQRTWRRMFDRKDIRTRSFR
jgi:hypothetical protein